MNSRSDATHGGGNVTEMTHIDVHITHIKAAGYSPRTVADRERLLHHADAALPQGLIRAAREEWETYLAHPGWAAETRANYFGHAAGFYAHMCAGTDPYLTLNPMADLIRPKVPPGVPDPVTDEELRDCLARSHGQWRLIITLAAYAALRRAEICALRREDVTAERIHVIAGKGGRDGWIPTRAEVWTLVGPMPPGPLLRRRTHLPADPNWLGVMARYHFHHRLGLPDVHLHRFRHWAATALTEADVPTVVVAQIMRHHSLNTTARYAQVADGKRARAMAALPTFATPGPGLSRPRGAAA